MKKLFKRYWFGGVIVFILLIAAILRFYKMAEVPHGMTWDEAAIGYNGYAIVKTRRDEWLTKLPVSFRSFGDYKAPLAIYVSGIFTFLFGMNLWAVRLPFILTGVATVGGTMWLMWEMLGLSKWKKQERKQGTILAGLLMMISPWHLHFSRTGFESGLALGLVIWGIAVLLFSLRIHKKKWLSWDSWLAGILFLVLSFYTYHSSKIVVPLLGVFLVAFLFKKLLGQRLKILVGGVFGLLGLYPLIKDSLYGHGLDRAGTLIFSQVESWQEGLVLFVKQFLAHLNPTFLVMGESTSFRHGDGVWGVLLPVCFVVVSIGFWGELIKLKNDQKKKKNLWAWWLGVIWVLVGIIPAALGTELVPHSNRSLLALPGFIILGVWGARELIVWLKGLKINGMIKGTHGEKNLLIVSVIGMMIVAESFFFFSYLKNYYSNFAAQSAEDFKDGYLEAFDFVKEYEKGDKEVEKILFTSEYGQPYIYALFARKTNPIWYQGGSLVKYEFSDKINVGDLARPNTVVVGGISNTDLPEEKADKLIFGSDGEVRFKVFVNKE